ncbi:hypothetical protein LZ31DRAFT_611705 [Colletotrichum somersetense]|nr:hypothetical protein LZ31DRAFT_611705 [Colletotrichum somersetense]
MRLLIKHGSSVNTMDASGCTKVLRATIQFATASPSSQSQQRPRSVSESFLHHAADFSHYRRVQMLEAAPSAAGGLKARDDQRTIKYYCNMYKLAHGIDTNLETPRKAKAIIKNLALLELPTDSDNNIDFVEMKENLELSPDGQCTTYAS